jgi:hypothetical protein
MRIEMELNNLSILLDTNKIVSVKELIDHFHIPEKEAEYEGIWHWHDGKTKRNIEIIYQWSVGFYHGFYPRVIEKSDKYINLYEMMPYLKGNGVQAKWILIAPDPADDSGRRAMAFGILHKETNVIATVFFGGRDLDDDSHIWVHDPDTFCRFALPSSASVHRLNKLKRSLSMFYCPLDGKCSILTEYLTHVLYKMNPLA